jgi:hypothetical protein
MYCEAARWRFDEATTCWECDSEDEHENDSEDKMSSDEEIEWQRPEE